MHTCLIYLLYNEQGIIDYVGRSKDFGRRLIEHRGVLGFRPKYEIIDSCSENCRNIEKFWICFYRGLGYKLRNIYYGQGPHCLSEEAKANLSEIGKSFWTQEQRNKQANRMRGLIFPLEHRQRMAESGKAVWAERRRKNPLPPKEKPRTISEALKGVPKSAQHRANLSIAAKARPPRPCRLETKEKMSRNSLAFQQSLTPSEKAVLNEKIRVGRKKGKKVDQSWKAEYPNIIRQSYINTLTSSYKGGYYGS